MTLDEGRARFQPQTQVSRSLQIASTAVALLRSLGFASCHHAVDFFSQLQSLAEEFFRQRGNGNGRWLLGSQEFKDWRDGISWRPGDRKALSPHDTLLH